MATDSDRILAAGQTVTLGDRTYTVRFGMRGLKMLEDSFGSIEQAGKALDSEAGAPVIGMLVNLLTAGLAEAKLSYDDVLDRAEPKRLREYTIAIAAALNEALPDVPSTPVLPEVRPVLLDEETDDPNSPAPASRSGSPGAVSTSSPRFASAAQMTSSGA